MTQGLLNGLEAGFRVTHPVIIFSGMVLPSLPRTRVGIRGHKNVHAYRSYLSEDCLNLKGSAKANYA